MLFNSWQFLLFFPIVTAMYYMLPHRARWVLLLLASCIFYMAFVPAYILILFATIVVDYYAGLLIETAQGSRRKCFLIVSILTNVGILAFFKYYNFFAWNMGELGQLIGWNYSPTLLDIILPIGLSFHTFQAMSYTIEVYRGHQAAERHFGIYSLYVMFYPQLVAGPIERPQNLLHQFREEHNFDYQQVIEGLKLMAWGMFKKVVIADRLAIAVNSVYSDPYSHQGLTLLLATVFFAFQVYCDFSGYSDIALGSALVMGFRLMKNFNCPYFATNMPQFWKRWHISLSAWFRDYVFIPLGGFRRSVWRPCMAMMITFALSGLWHGASWNFVIWGVLNGLFVVFYMLTGRFWQALGKSTRIDQIPGIGLIGIITTFCQFAFSLIFFRANSLADALYVVAHLFDGLGSVAPLSSMSLLGLITGLGFTPLHFVLAVTCVALLLLAELVEQQGVDIRHWIGDRSVPVRWAAYYGLICSICIFGVFNQSKFIYFQF